jgi:purine nucleoside phosphorylase
MAVVAGSGMSALGDRLRERYGHRGVVCAGEVEGRPLALVLGRRHFYEGGSNGMAPLMVWLSGRGVGEVVAISAAGSVRGVYQPGELIVATQVLDLQNRRTVARDRAGRAGRGASAGRPGETRYGPSPRLQESLESAARRAGVGLQRGVLACGAGPAYETPAEIRALRGMGADVATMSSAPELLSAGELGMEIAIIAAITNPGTGIGQEPPNHVRVLEEASAMCGALGDLLVELIVNK